MMDVIRWFTIRFRAEKKMMLKNTKKTQIERLELELIQLKLDLKASQEKRGEARFWLESASPENVLEFINDVVFSLSGEGRVTFVSASVFKCFGYKPEEVEGQFFTSFLPQNEAIRVSSLLDEAISKGKENLLIEFQFITKSKELIWIEQNTRLLRNSEGDLFATAVARDITEEKNAKVDLRKSESKYQRIIENMELGLMEVDLEGHITKVYDKFCELSGFSKTELLGQKADDILLAPEFKVLMAEQSALRRKGVSEVYEIEMLTKNKERLVLLISGAPIFDAQERVVGSIGIHYDITQRKNNEDALKKAHEETKAARKAESKFLAKVSHEIKTPINAILGLAHLLSASEMTQEQLGFANDIKNSSLLLNNLISDVLDVNAINSGVLKVKNDFLDFHDLLRVQQKMFQLKVGVKPIEIHLDIDESVPRKILSDYNLLNRSLMSILGNAVKFTDAGLIKIVASQVYEHNSTFLKIEIQDTGMGIEAADLSLVFEKFHQVKKENGELSSGTGLGLNIAKEYIELLGGTLEVESAVNKGSLFSVFLPLKQAVEASNRPLVKKQVFSASGRVLVVEDNEINRTYCSRLLNRWGLEYQLANDGQEALDWLGKELFDLVLMDVQMPNVDGIQATIHTRHFTKNNNRKIPIIGISTFAQESDIQRALEAGMNDHIAKPYSPDELEEKLKRWLPSTSVPSIDELNEFEFDSRLDGNMLKEFYGGDLDYILEMFDLFLVGFSNCKASLNEAVLSQDFKMLQAFCHKIKPTMTMIGLPQKAKEVADVETCAKEKKSDAFRTAHAFVESMNEIKSIILSDNKRLKKYINTENQ